MKEILAKLLIEFVYRMVGEILVQSKHGPLSLVKFESQDSNG